MSDNFKAIYKILSHFEKAMDSDDVDYECISPDRLELSEQRWAAIMEMLTDERYIMGITVKRSPDGGVLISNANPRITLRGLEYLQENSLMKKAANLLKDIANVIK